MSKSVGKSIKRVDAFEKATGRAKYVDDLCGREALIAKVYHSTIAHGYVKAIDTKEAEAIPGVVKVLTCFDVPEIQFPTDNVLAHTDIYKGNYKEAIKEESLIRVEGWYDTPTVQHCHIENHGCYAYEEAGRVVVVTSTQIPHIVRRCTAQALGRPWGDVRIIKPYVGGGFGNKQDALYEPLCAWCSTQVGGRLVHYECTRKEAFVSNRVRHAIRTHIISYVRPNGELVARKFGLVSFHQFFQDCGRTNPAQL